MIAAELALCAYTGYCVYVLCSRKSFNKVFNKFSLESERERQLDIHVTDCCSLPSTKDDSAICLSPRSLFISHLYTSTGRREEMRAEDVHQLF
jgi:hypothetical protein